VNPILNATDLSLAYADKTVLEDISLELHHGEVLGVVGPNGVGKTTLIKALSGVLPPTRGHVMLGRKDLAAMPYHQRAREIAVVPQATRLPGAFTALDVVLMGRTPYLGWLGNEGEEDRRIALDAMQRTRTANLADRLIAEMSGGEQQRVLIARALTQTPSVLLLDEPTAHLDLRHQDDVLHLVRSLADQEQFAVLLALHDLNLVSRFADRVALLSNKSIFRLGPPDDVLQPAILEEVYGMKIVVTDHPLYGTPMVLT